MKITTKMDNARKEVLSREFQKYVDYLPHPFDIVKQVDDQQIIFKSGVVVPLGIASKNNKFKVKKGDVVSGVTTGMDLTRPLFPNILVICFLSGFIEIRCSKLLKYFKKTSGLKEIIHN